MEPLLMILGIFIAVPMFIILTVMMAALTLDVCFDLWDDIRERRRKEKS
jgi:hypothetical protein